MSDRIKVAIKVRPLIAREISEGLSSQWKVKDNTILQLEGGKEKGDSYSFDYVFDDSTKNDVVFHNMARPIVESAVHGFNGTIFAYGQTSSGKTSTMMGNRKEPGIIPLTIQYLFQVVNSISGREFLLRASYIEIYNEKVNDLLERGKAGLKLREGPDGSITIVDLKEELVHTPAKIMDLMRRGEKTRRIAETNMNERSSRSHTIFRIIIESRIPNDGEDGAVQVSHLNLVDLAGSERVDQTGARGERLKEGCAINRSLFMLSHVISQLSEGQDQYVNFRDSKLTRILQSSLGGNALTAVICAVTPAAIEETASTVGFAMRAINVKVKPHVNEVLSDAALLRRYNRQIARLQDELQKAKTGNGNEEVKEIQNKLQEQVRQNELLQERLQHSELLQERISLLQAMVLGSTKSDCDTEKRRALRRRTWCGNSSKQPAFTSGLEAIDEESNGNDLFESCHQSLFQNSSMKNLANNDLFETPLEEFELQLIDYQNRFSAERPESPDSLTNITFRSSRSHVMFEEPTEQVERVFSIDASVQTEPCPAKTVLERTIGCDAAFSTPPPVLRERINYYQREYDELRKFTTLEKQIFDGVSYKQVEDFDKENKGLHQTIVDQERMILDLNCKTSNLTSENKMLREELELKTQEANKLLPLRDVEKTLSAKLVEVAELQKQLKAAEKRIQHLENEKSDFDWTLKSAENKLQSRITELTQSLEEAWNELGNRCSSSVETEETKDQSNIKRKYDLLEEQNVLLNTQLKEKDNILESLKQRITEFEKDMQASQQKITSSGTETIIYAEEAHSHSGTLGVELERQTKLEMLASKQELTLLEKGVSTEKTLEVDLDKISLSEFMGRYKQLKVNYDYVNEQLNNKVKETSTLKLQIDELVLEKETHLKHIKMLEGKQEDKPSGNDEDSDCHLEIDENNHHDVQESLESYQQLKQNYYNVKQELTIRFEEIQTLKLQLEEFVSKNEGTKWREHEGIEFPTEGTDSRIIETEELNKQICELKQNIELLECEKGIKEETIIELKNSYEKLQSESVSKDEKLVELSKFLMDIEVENLDDLKRTFKTLKYELNEKEKDIATLNFELDKITYGRESVLNENGLNEKYALIRADYSVLNEKLQECNRQVNEYKLQIEYLESEKDSNCKCIKELEENYKLLKQENELFDQKLRENFNSVQNILKGLIKDLYADDIQHKFFEDETTYDERIGQFEVLESLLQMQMNKINLLHEENIELNNLIKKENIHHKEMLQAFNDMAEENSNLSKMLNDFIIELSHELKSRDVAGLTLSEEVNNSVQFVLQELNQIKAINLKLNEHLNGLSEHTAMLRDAGGHFTCFHINNYFDKLKMEEIKEGSTSEPLGQGFEYTFKCPLLEEIDKFEGITSADKCTQILPVHQDTSSIAKDVKMNQNYHDELILMSSKLFPGHFGVELIERLEIEIEDMHEKYEECRHIFQKIKTELQRLEMTEEQDDMKNDIETSIISQTQKNTNLSAGLMEIYEMVCIKIRKFEELKQNYREIAVQLEANTKLLQAAVHENSNMEIKKNEEKSEDLTSLSNQLNSNLTSELEATKKKLFNKTREIESCRRTLVKEIRSLNSACDVQLLRDSQLSELLKNLLALIMEKEAELISHLQLESEHLHREMNESSRAYADKDRKRDAWVRELETEIESMQKEFSKTENNKMKESLKALQEEKDNLLKKLKQSENDSTLVKTLKEERDDLTEKIQSYKKNLTDIKTLEEERNELIKKIKQFESDIARVKILEAEKDDLAMKLKQAENDSLVALEKQREDLFKKLQQSEHMSSYIKNLEEERDILIKKSENNLILVNVLQDKRDELKIKLQQSEMDLSKIQLNNHNLSSRNGTITDELNSIKLLLEQKDVKLSHLHEQLHHFQGLKNNLSCQNETLQKSNIEIVTLEENISDLEFKNSQMIQLLKNKEKEFTQKDIVLCDVRKNLEYQIEQSNKMKSELGAQIETLNEEITDLRTRNSKLVQSVADKEEEITQKNIVLSELHSKLENLIRQSNKTERELKMEIETLKGDMRSRNSQLENIEKELIQKERALCGLQKKLEDQSSKTKKELEIQIETLNEVITDLKNTNSKLVQSIGDKEEEITQKNIVLSELHNKFEDLIKQSNKTERELKMEIETLKGDMKSRNSQFETIEKELIQKERALCGLQKKLEDQTSKTKKELEIQIETLNEEITVLKTRNSKLVQSVADKEEEITQKNNVLSELHSKLENLIRQSNKTERELKMEIETLKGDMRSRNSQLENIEKELIQKERALCGLQKKLEDQSSKTKKELEIQIETLNEVITDLKNTNSKLVQSIGDKEEEITQKNIVLSELHNKFEDLIKQSNKTERELKMEIETLKGDMKSRKPQFETIEKELIQKERALCGLQKKLEDQTSKTKKELEIQIETLNEEITVLKTRNSKLVQSVADKEEITQKNIVLSELHSKLENLIKQSNKTERELKMVIETLKGDMKSRNSQLQNIEKELIQKERALQKLEQQIEKCNETKGELNTQIETFEENMADLKSKNSNLLQVVESKEEEIAHKNILLSELHEILEDQFHQSNKTKGELQILEGDVAESLDSKDKIVHHMEVDGEKSKCNKNKNNEHTSNSEMEETIFCQNENKIFMLQEINSLKNEIVNLKSKNSQFIQMLEAKVTEVKALNEKLELKNRKLLEVKNQFKKIVSDLKEASNKNAYLLSNNEELLKNNNLLEVTIKQEEKEIKKIKDQMNAVIAEREPLLLHLKTLQNENDKFKSEVKANKISISKINILVLKEQQLGADKKLLESKLADTVDELVKINNSHQKLLEELDRMKQERNELDSNSETLKEILAKHFSQQGHLLEENENCNSFDVIQKYVRNLINDDTKLGKSKCSSCSQNSSLELLSKLQKEIDELREKNRQLVDKKSTLSCRQCLFKDYAKLKEKHMKMVPKCSVATATEITGCQCSELAKKLQQSRETIAELNVKIGSLELQMTEDFPFKNKVLEMESNVNYYKNKNNQLKNEIRSLYHKMHDPKKMSENRPKSDVQNMKSCSVQTSDEDKSFKAYADSQGNINSIDVIVPEEVQNLKSELREKEDLIQILKTECQEKQTTIATLEKKLLNLSHNTLEGRDGNEDDRSLKEKELEELKLQLLQALEKNQNLDDEMEEMLIKINDQEREIEQTNGISERLLSELQTSQEKFRDFKKDSEKQQAHLSYQMKELAAKVEDLADKNRQLMKESEGANHCIQNLRKEYTKLKAEQTTVAPKCSVATLTDMSGCQCLELTEKLRQSTLAVVKCNSEIGSLKLQIESEEFPFQKKVKEIEENLTFYRKKNSELKTELRSLQHQLHEARRMCESCARRNSLSMKSVSVQADVDDIIVDYGGSGIVRESTLFNFRIRLREQDKLIETLKSLCRDRSKKILELQNQPCTKCTVEERIPRPSIHAETQTDSMYLQADEIMRLRYRIHNQEKQLQILKNQCKEKSDTITALEQKLYKSMEGRIPPVYSQEHSHSSPAEVELQDVKLQFQQALEEKCNLDAENEDMLKKIEEQEEEIRRINDINERLHLDIQVAKSNVSDLKKYNEKLQARLSSQVKELSAENEDLKDRNRQLLNESEGASHYIEDLHRKYAMLKAEKTKVAAMPSTVSNISGCESSESEIKRSPRLKDVHKNKN